MAAKFSQSPQKSIKKGKPGSPVKHDPQQIYINLDIQEYRQWSSRQDPILDQHIPAGTKLGIQILCYLGKPAVKTAELAAEHIVPIVAQFVAAISDENGKLDYQVHASFHPF